MNSDYQSRKEELKKLKSEHIKNKDEFEKKQYTMNIDQIILNNILLKIEGDVYFGRYESKCERTERREKEFMKMISCCEMGFSSLLEFGEHKESVHDKSVNLKNKYDKLPSRSKPVEIDEINDTKNNVPTFYDENTISKKLIFDCEKPYRCHIPGCINTYRSAQELRYHMRSMHVEYEEENKPYKCSVLGCKKRYKNSNGLKYHLSHGH